MKNNELTANIISPYYLHEVASDFGLVKGVLLKLNLTKQNINMLIPHENIDTTKVFQVSKLLSRGELTDLPIIIGISDGDFSAILDKCDSKIGDNIIEKDMELELKNQLELIKTLILIDGHHRYTAAKQLLTSGQNICLWCWLVPFDKLKIHSFTKIFTNDEQIDISKLVTDDYEVSTVPPVVYTDNLLHITLYLHGYYYYILSKSEKEFLCEMERLKNKLGQNKLALVEIEEMLHEETSIMSNSDNHLILEHAQVTHEMVLNTINRGKVLPLHSTCFKPKPEKIVLDKFVCCCVK